MITMAQEAIENTSKMSMISLPMIPACIMIFKIDKSTTFLPIELIGIAPPELKGPPCLSFEK